MDENEYRSAYHSINATRCVFEKSILAQLCNFRCHERFNLAEREGVRCTEPSAQSDCSLFLTHCRQQARFALGLPEIVGNLLPHSKEVQVQKGALLGLAPELPNEAETPIDDIRQLIEKAHSECNGDLKSFPYQRLMPAISHCQPRLRRRGKKRNND